MGLPQFLNVEVGLVINAIHTSLDLLAASLAIRNGVEPSDTHFPIFKSSERCSDPVKGVQGKKCKKWFSSSNRAIIEDLKPYKGGDALLYPLRQLDNMRKHRRLISVKPQISEVFIFGLGLNGVTERRRLNHKTILFRVFTQSSDPEHVARLVQFVRHAPGTSKGNLQLTVEVAFDETAVGVDAEPTIPMLRKFAERATGIIQMFE